MLFSAKSPGAWLQCFHISISFSCVENNIPEDEFPLFTSFRNTYQIDVLSCILPEGRPQCFTILYEWSVFPELSDEEHFLGEDRLEVFRRQILKSVCNRCET